MSNLDDVGRLLVEHMRGFLEVRAGDGDLDLVGLVLQLENAIDGLAGHAELAWVEELRSAWWPLEMVNATNLASGRRSLSAEEVSAVNDALAELRLMLKDE